MRGKGMQALVSRWGIILNDKGTIWEGHWTFDSARLDCLFGARPGPAPSRLSISDKVAASIDVVAVAYTTVLLKEVRYHGSILTLWYRKYSIVQRHNTTKHKIVSHL